MKFNVVGQVFLADGFDYIVEANSAEEAEQIVRKMIEDEDAGQPDPGLQEICINSVERMPE